MADTQLDLFANPHEGIELHWFPGSMPPEDGQKILFVYETEDCTPSEIIFGTYYQKFIDQGFEKPPIWWTPMPKHPVSAPHRRNVAI